MNWSAEFWDRGDVDYRNHHWLEQTTIGVSLRFMYVLQKCLNQPNMIHGTFMLQVMCTAVIR